MVSTVATTVYIYTLKGNISILYSIHYIYIIIYAKGNVYCIMYIIYLYTKW